MPRWAPIAGARMSPSVAPLSADPYAAMARFSSSISSALIDSAILRVALSMLVTLASILSPMAKRSGRCSLRSRDRSFLRMKPMAPLLTVTSSPLSSTLATTAVTVAPLAMVSAALTKGSFASCLMPRLMRSFSTSTSITLTLTALPFL